MAPTHALVGLLVAVPVAFVAPEYASPVAPLTVVLWVVALFRSR